MARPLALGAAFPAFAIAPESRFTFPFITPAPPEPLSRSVTVARLLPAAVLKRPPRAVAPTLANLPRLSLAYFLAMPQQPVL